jgi:hypothetical protein
MNILYYNPGRSITAKRLLATIKSDGVADRVDVYRTLEAFSERLRQPAMDKTIAIVLTPTEKDLLDIYFIKHLFCRVPVVLLLPDRQRETVAVGRRCGSISISCIHSGFSEITGALQALTRGVHHDREPDGYEGHQYAA